MVKKRVHELAKELNIESKEILQQLHQMGINVRSHMSTLEDEEIERIKNHYGKPKAADVKNRAPEGEQVQTRSGKEPGRQGGAQRKRRHRQDRGPGLVDRVPARPPDRRFTEKPLRTLAGGGARGGAALQKKQGAQPGVNQKGAPGNQDQPKQAPPVRPVQPPEPEPVAGAQPEQKAAVLSQERAKTADRALAERKNDAVKPPKNQKPFAGGAKNVSPVPRAGGRLKSAEKGKPDKIKALEKTKAQERVKQFEKQAFKEKESKSRFEKDFDREDRIDKQVAYKKGGKGQKKRTEHQEHIEPAAVREKKPISIGETITVKSLAEKMAVSSSEVIKKLMELGVIATINQEIDADTATLVANELGFEVQVKVEMDKEALLLQEPEDDPASLQPRPCVVTIMGHVDHGKTSLLDAIRHSNVTAQEAGGITQHIGAYQVEHKGKKITFVDTPGHEAFTAMRARGAKVTDIAVLVVAADDGVMPQTVEAINHARAAEVPIIVAVNKIDKPEADPEKVKRQLTEYNLVAEEWGGDTIFVEVSAKEKRNLDELLEMILLVAEIGEYKANPNRPARGTVIEAELDKGRGPVATVLVQNGTLRVGDFIIAGVAYGKVRAMMDHTGRRVKKAGPSMPVEVLGFSEVPPAGELFFAVEDEKLGRQIISERQVKKREEELRIAAPRVSLDDLFTQIQEGQVKELNIIIKADVQGSVEAVKQALQQISTDEVRVNVIHGGVGAITETDIMLASASNAIVIGFNVRPDVNARKAIETEKVDIRLYRVIYDAIEDIKAAMSGLLDPEYKEVTLGRAEVRKTFKVSKVGTIAGCYVTEGKITRDAGVRVIRDGIVIHEGVLESLKRFKDDAREVAQGYECGMTVEKFNDIREGDQIEAFIMEAVKRELA
ncbi:translation initiation factor IF-2 [Desulfallas sp. Bu1-1]|uniref:translation initiation factor IF-2 n=1 Tax=Desulfallas sp. Bu1-1 TaxID=2787620 RepID=UPI0018A0B29D|nr:translation initiation factor IF-2 [Desulfallas sp. Bu1-1]MBF7082372.1 translation initiation factor IF-2 [Desulfallas sp. Bu1-1]